ncbi:unnamed protein product [Caenorhabditis bovis]|uniref:Protein kinase domain-containing protein n=1 Tax=Caenorhabditis bovis TaxID=2654633 RepID=A0A8S1FF86_9PELO|nr:unnamed protein product [Caenorhabditis bovis]
MMEMVSNARIHDEIGAATRRNEGVRCSKRILDGICLQMAATPFAAHNNNNKSCNYDDHFDCEPYPCSSKSFNDDYLEPDVIESVRNDENEASRHHPVLSLIGPLFAPEDFEILEPLGEGFFSKVYKVRHASSGEILVLKENKPTESSRRSAHADAAREAAMMRQLKHGNVLELRGICISRGDCGTNDGKWDANLLVTYCEGGSLASLVLDRTLHLSWQRRVRYALDIARAMEYIHSQGIIHRDLTSSNVLIRHDNHEHDNWGKAVVADFGLSCPFPEPGEKLAQVGTTYFMSPECLKEEYYDEKSDVFSFGIILCQMIARIDVDPDGGIPRTSKFGFDYMLFTPLCPLDTPIELLKLAFNSCVMDPAARPSFEESRRKLEDIVVSLPNPQHSKSMEMTRDGKESRLGRSRSDAALKRPKSLAATSRKLSTNFNVGTRPVIEGEVSDETHAHKMEALARDVARDEPEFRHINPFLGHERFRNERKILPKKATSTPRRRSATKTDGAPKMYATQASLNSTPRRRCLSMPSFINDLSSSTHYTSFSYDGTFGGDESLDDSEYVDANASPASGIPMAYRDLDRCFLKQMKRFPSRRHTMMSDVKTSASNFDISTTDGVEGPSAKHSHTKIAAKNREISVAQQKRPSRCVVIVGDDEPTTTSTPPPADTIVRQSNRQRRLSRVCSAAHRNSNECAIL